MGTSNRKKCKCCKTLFIPDPRNASRQGYCSKPECRKTSKRASQRSWFKKPENRDHFCGPINVARVQEWRRNHPGYWKKKKTALQDSLNPQPAVNTDNEIGDAPQNIKTTYLQSDIGRGKFYRVFSRLTY